MTLKDFNIEKCSDTSNSYNSKDRFWFENDKVGFWYRIYLTSYTYQPGWDDRRETKYQVILIVDEESIHSSHDLSHYALDRISRFGFLLKETIKRGKFDEEYLEKLLNSALKLKIENKIKVDRYQKILGIINGTRYYV